MYRPIVFMFSGLGSHYFHMGADLYKKHELFRKKMLEMNDIIQQATGSSLIDFIYDENRARGHLFDDTLFSSLSIFMVEYSLAYVLTEMGIKPDYVLGASLGEFVAAAFAKVTTIEAIIQNIIEFTGEIEKNCRKGSMLGILHDYRLYDEIPIIHKKSEMAAINFQSHFVVSGKNEDLLEIEDTLKKQNIICQMLPVSFAFHSSFIDPAEETLRRYFKNQVYQTSTIPFISCAHAEEKSGFYDDYAWDIIRKPILFEKTIHYLEQQQKSIFIDLGPSGTLSTYVKYINSGNEKSKSFEVLTPFGRDLVNLEKIDNYFTKEQLIQKNRKGGRMRTFVFPGQGSQKRGMGKDLFDKYRKLTEKADNILGYSIAELCINDPEKKLNQTQYTQPAIFTVNALSYLERIEQNRSKPDYVAGHSLGEYNALFAAGAFDFEQGLKLVQKRGELMSQASGGGMAAVVGLPEDEIDVILKENGLQSISVANYNSSSQIVIAGPKTDIVNAEPLFKDAGATLYLPLNVSGAFHTRYMNDARTQFKAFIDGFTFAELLIPVISNVSARPYQPEAIKEHLLDQITSPVKWTESIRYLMGKTGMEFEEIGPGKVLTKLVAKIQTESEPLIIAETEPIDEIMAKDEEPDKSSNKKNFSVTMESIGSKAFKKAYNVKYAYISGGMYRGIASKDIVVRMAKSGMLGFLGTGGMDLGWIEKMIHEIKATLSNGESYGMNLLNSPLENETVDLYLKNGIKNVEAAAYLQMTPALVKYRLKGLSGNGDGSVKAENKIMAKVSRPEVAEVFLSPAPERIVNQLLEANVITQDQAVLSKKVPMCDDLCVEADSGGHTDQGVISALMPAMLRLKEEMKNKHRYPINVRVGAAGGIGTPEAAAAAIILGADFILTGSINQCTVEAGTSDTVKSMLQQINVQDTDYAPAGDMFEMGAKVQVLRKGVFFPARANKLFSLYQHHNSLDEIDEKIKKQIQEKYFKRSFDEIYEDCKSFYPPEEIQRAEQNPKQKMAMVFKWYFGHTTQLALKGNEENKVSFQVHCGPALGAFNQWVKGSELEDWRNRHVDEIAIKLMRETAQLLEQRIKTIIS